MVYVFKCQEHGQFEVRQGIHTEHVAKCPVCGSYGQRVYTIPSWKWKTGPPEDDPLPPKSQEQKLHEAMMQGV